MDLNLSTTSKPWWQTDVYNLDKAVPDIHAALSGVSKQISEAAGEAGVARCAASCPA